MYIILPKSLLNLSEAVNIKQRIFKLLNLDFKMWREEPKKRVQGLAESKSVVSTGDVGEDVFQKIHFCPPRFYSFCFIFWIKISLNKTLNCPAAKIQINKEKSW